MSAGRGGTKVVAQRKEWDCGVAAIAMLLGESYGDVAQRVRETVDDPRLTTRGLILRQLEDVIASFGYRTRRVYRQDGYLDKATGILGLLGGECAPHGHWVMVKHGMILDPTGGEAWRPTDYMRAGKCRPVTLVTVEKKP